MHPDEGHYSLCFNACIHLTYFYNSDNVDKENSSESEYLPSEDELRLLEHNDNRKVHQKEKLVLNTTVSSVSSVDVSIRNTTSACNNEDMYVEKFNIKAVKQNFCYFCSKLQTQLPRHLETVHCNEPEIKKFAMLHKSNPERKKIIDIIRKNGNFKFNTNSEVNNGKLVVDVLMKSIINRLQTL